MFTNLYLALFGINPLVFRNRERWEERWVAYVCLIRDFANGFDLTPVALSLVIDGKFSLFLENFELAVFAAHVEGINIGEDTVHRPGEIGTKINLQH